MVGERKTARARHRPLRPARGGPTRRALAGILSLATAGLLAASCSSPPVVPDGPSDRELLERAKDPSLDESVPGAEPRPSAAAQSLLDRMVAEQRALAKERERDGEEALPAVLREEPVSPGETEFDPDAIDREIGKALDGAKEPPENASPPGPLALANPPAEEGSPGPVAAEPVSPTLRSPAAQTQPDPKPAQAQPAPAQAQPAAEPAGAKPPAGAQAAQEQAVPEEKPRPAGKISFFRFFHKTASDFTRFLSSDFPDMVRNRNVAEVNGKPHNVMFFGDDATLQMLRDLASQFDEMNLEIEQVAIRPKYIGVDTLLQSLTLASVANVWDRVEESLTTQQLNANKWKTIGVLKRDVYAPGGISQGNEAPLPVAPKVPYVFAMPSKDPFKIPPQTTGQGITEQKTIDFASSSSTERRGLMIAVGTAEDIRRIQAFVDTVDRPATRVMIEVQLIELDANALSDLGLDSVQMGHNKFLYTFSSPFPGENIVQPGLPDFREDDVVVPNVVQEGFGVIFDDTVEDVSGRFLANIHMLVRQGDATVKARPKILTLDDRPSLLHIGDEVPTFQSTRVDRDVTGGNFVEQIDSVTTQYVGFTLNIRPRIAGEDNDEVALQLEVVSNQLRDRERVFAQDLLGIPVISRRRFTGQTRVRNHRPIVLGGLIQEEESESTAKVPFLGDIPIFGRLFSRVQKEKRRTEIILVVTPHILSEKGWDPNASPKESQHFDTFDSVLFNDSYIMKGRDVWGIDPITKQPAMMDGKQLTEEEVVDLSLLNIVKKRELVSKLGIFQEYMPDEASRLGWLKRRYPERSVYYWEPDLQVIYYKAAAIVIENIKELNPDIMDNYEEFVTPRREIVLPTTPYRMSLSYDKYKTYVEHGGPVLRSGVKLSERTVTLLRDVGSERTMSQFADFARRRKFQAERHRQLRYELQRLFAEIYPNSNQAETDDYVALLKVLADAHIDFIAMATYFQNSLEGRYLAIGAPDIGNFEEDLEEFRDSTITIDQRAERLRDLDNNWGSGKFGESDGE